jgi:molybdopterin molybdotransferase
MLAVFEARELVISRAARLTRENRSLDDASGLVLAENVAAEGDSPPFDKSLVDGYAVRASDLEACDSIVLSVVDEIDAGSLPKRALEAGECALVMTGAPLPAGADAVVMLEVTERISQTEVRLAGRVRAGQNRLARAAEYRAGETLAQAGDVLSSAKIGLLAAAGKARVCVVPHPALAIVSTGDEVVNANQVPGPGQIRNSNGPMLSALFRAFGATIRSSQMVGDDEAALKAHFAGLLERAHAGELDLIVATGGVSAGRRDLVPAAFESVGVSRVFHKVALKPGKPLWFGVGPQRPGRPPVLVFGLPGNPVSGLVCGMLFVLPALQRLAGRQPGHRIPQTARLASSYQHRGNRMTFHPVRVANRDPLELNPMRWAGSADLLTVANADGFAVFEPGDRNYEIGETVGYFPLSAAGRALNSG